MLTKNNLKAGIIALRFELVYRFNRCEMEKVRMLREHLAAFKTEFLKIEEDVQE